MDRTRTTAVVSVEVAEGEFGVGWLYRDEPDGPGDSGWRVFSGAEDEAFADDPANFVEMPLGELIRIDPAVESVLAADVGTCLEWDEGSESFRAVQGFDPADRG